MDLAWAWNYPYPGVSVQGECLIRIYYFCFITTDSPAVAVVIFHVIMFSDYRLIAYPETSDRTGVS